MEEISGSIYFRPLNGPDGFAPGQEMKGDLHSFDHTTVLFNGHWQVVIERRKRDGSEEWEVVRRLNAEGPFHLLVEADCRHSFKYFGQTIPQWMEPQLATMTQLAREEFRKEYESIRGRGWCIYSRQGGAGWGPYS